MNFVLEYMAVSLSWRAVASLGCMEISVSVACRCPASLQGILGQAETRVMQRYKENRSSCAVCESVIIIIYVIHCLVIVVVHQL